MMSHSQTSAVFAYQIVWACYTVRGRRTRIPRTASYLDEPGEELPPCYVRR